jgi:hypothetical protein
MGPGTTAGRLAEFRKRRRAGGLPYHVADTSVAARMVRGAISTGKSWLIAPNQTMIFFWREIGGGQGGRKQLPGWPVSPGAGKLM